MAIPNKDLANVTKYYIETVLDKTWDESLVSIKQDSEEEGPVIASWDEATYGAQPTVATIMQSKSAYETKEAANTYKKARKKAIVEKWSIEDQLEALTEFHETPSRPEKLNALLAYIGSVKQSNPKS